MILAGQSRADTDYTADVSVLPGLVESSAVVTTDASPEAEASLEL